ncbi:MAG: uroporphyrinogen decarboxylase family protein [Kiritimatiellia bacterium]|jgi:uroporphyrinogen decarboxylase
MIEAGVEVWQSIQPENDIVALKKRYGKNITFWGGMPAGLLVAGTPAQVRETGRQVLRDCAPGGGFVYATSHSVMPGARHENYLAMLDVLSSYGAGRKNI